MYLSIALISVIILLVVANVVGRYFFRKPVLGHVELVQLLSVALVFFILAYTEYKGGHIKVDLVVRLLSRRIRAILGAITGILTLAFAVLMCWRGITLATANITPIYTRSEALSIPIAPFMFCLALGSFLFSLELIISFFGYISELKNHKETGK